jgi:hypothetical protein
MPTMDIVRVKENIGKPVARAAGVTGVGIGYRYEGGELVEELVISVFVGKS